MPAKPGEGRVVANFGAGPAKLPEQVVLQLTEDLLNWNGTGVGILEVSHRSREFSAMMAEAEARLRTLIGIPEEYAVLFMQGGGTLQFSAVVMNLVRKDAGNKTVDYLVSGSWSKKAAQEASHMLSGTDVAVNEIAMFKTRDDLGVESVPASEWALSGGDQAAYVYYCDNETIDGVEMPGADFISDVLEARQITAPLVVDMSSNFLSRSINITRFGVIFATAQKNFGPAGVSVVIALRRLLKESNGPSAPIAPIPTMLDYSVFEKNNSLYNTPPCLAINTCNLVFKWILDQFGTLKELEGLNLRKSALLYKCIVDSHGFYRTVVPSTFQSRMNVVFRICKADGGADRGACTALEDLFVKESEEHGLLQLRGHRSVGGIRVSLYNAVTLAEAARVVQFMDLFAAAHRHD